MAILSGYRVIDCSIAMAGPFAAQRLGDLGADVIKVEPVAGEWQRFRAAGGATGRRINTTFLSLNRNKRSLAIDLKSAEGRAALFDLVRSADVFIQNYRPGVAQRLGVDYAALSAINPRLIYVSMSGYGETGPYALRPGQDLILQAMSGAMLSAGRQDQAPAPAGQFLADAVTAYSAFEGALAALLHRERTGEGQLVEVNMLDAVLTFQMQELSVFTAGGVPQARSDEPHAHCYIRSPYGVFATTDGYIVIAFANLARLGDLIGVPDFAGMDDETDSWRHRDAIFAKVRTAIATRSSAEWLDLFGRDDIWSGKVYDYADVVADPQVVHNGSFVEYDHPSEGRVKTPGFPIRFARSPAAITRGAPQIGEHSRDVLGEAGLAPEAIDRLIAAGVVRQD
jgi:crotonobetainyl-CoA:carnitine CoA-transferase CaiB-like acyl-CoA transferase